MRILRVSQKTYPDVKGGAPYHVHALSRDQASMGHDVTVLTVRQDDSLPHVEERDGYTVVRFDSLLSPLGNDISPGLAQYLCGGDEFDVVHAHSHLYFATNLAALRRFLGGPPLAVTNHGLFSQNAPEWVFDLYLRTLGRWTFNQADVVFCYTEADKERVREYGVSSEIAVVSNGIDTDRFTPKGPESDLIAGSGPVVLFVGRLVEGKRPGLALEAFAAVKEEYSGAEMYLCGEGPLREELEELASELGVSDAVVFLGQLPYDEMPDVYRSADVLVLPSRAEGVPRTVLESMASGIPVVVSDLPQVRGVVAKSGEIVETADGDAFGEAVCEVLERSCDSGETKSMYSWERTVKQTTNYLQNIC